MNRRRRVGMAEAVKIVFSKYAAFGGRARRSEFWWWTVASLLVYVLAFLIDLALDLGFYVLTATLLIGLFLPTLSVTVRRLHDTGRSGGWYFISYVPLIGGFWLFILLALEGDPVENRFGPSPKWGLPQRA